MEKVHIRSWNNHGTLAKCHESLLFTNFVSEFYRICASFKKLSLVIESLHFPQNVANTKVEQNVNHGISRSGQEKGMGFSFFF